MIASRKLLIAGAALLLVGAWVALRSAPPPRLNALPPPWEVSVSSDGSTSEVLGVRLGTTTLAEARRQFGGDLQLALIEQPDRQLALEGYAARVESAFVTGAVVLAAAAPSAFLDAARQRANYAANLENIDDVGSLRALVQRMVDERGVDPARVFATGLSNGGHMAYKLGLEAPQLVAAIAAVGANLPVAASMESNRETSTCCPSPVRWRAWIAAIRAMPADENRLGVPPPMNTVSTGRPQTCGRAISRSASSAET